MLNRRQVLGGVGALGAAAALAPWPAIGQSALPANRNFVVLRDGNQIGHHTISFARDGADVAVEVDVALKVKLAFVTLYSLQHRNREVWRGGKLHTIDTDTVENGKNYAIKGHQAADGFRAAVTTGDKTEERTLPATIVPTSYWNPATVRQTALLNSVNGKLLDVKVLERGTEPVKINATPVPARKFSITGELTLDLWYDAGNEVVRLAFENRGSLIEYDLRA
jgi:hypothetical protein